MCRRALHNSLLADLYRCLCFTRKITLPRESKTKEVVYTQLLSTSPQWKSSQQVTKQYSPCNKWWGRLYFKFGCIVDACKLIHSQSHTFRCLTRLSRPRPRYKRTPTHPILYLTISVLELMCFGPKWLIREVAVSLRTAGAIAFLQHTNSYNSFLIGSMTITGTLTC